MHSSAIDNNGLRKMIYLIAVSVNQPMYPGDEHIHTCYNWYFLWLSFTSCCTQENKMFFLSSSSLLPLSPFDGVVIMWLSFLNQILNFTELTEHRHKIYHLKCIMDWKFPKCKSLVTEIIDFSTLSIPHLKIP